VFNSNTEVSAPSQRWDNRVIGPPLESTVSKCCYHEAHKTHQLTRKLNTMIRNTSLSTFALILLLSVSFSIHLFSQEGSRLTGAITGRVIDASTREPLPSANVVVVGTTIGAATDLNGDFTITNVPIGPQAVRASVLGYKPIVKTDLTVMPSKPVVVIFALIEATVELDEVTVTAEYFQKQPDRPVSLQTQSYEEIRRLPGGFEDVVRAVSILPGVAQAQAGRNDLIVRGGAPSENLSVVDGIEISNINHFGTQGASGGPLSFVNLDFVTETAFSSGGFGARYGDKLSSVLTIDLRDGRSDRWRGKGTIAATQFGLNAEGPMGETGSVIFSARRSYLDFIFRAAGFAFVPEYWDFLSKANYKIGRDDEVSVLAIAALDNVKLFNDTPDKRLDNSRILVSSQDQFLGGVRWLHLFGQGFWTVTLGQTIVQFDTQQRDTLLLPIFSNDSYERESSLQADVLYQISRNTELSFGVQGRIVQFSSDMFLRPFWTNYGQLISVDASYETTAQKAGAFIQLSQRWGNLQTIGGGRIDYFDMIKDKTVFSPRLALTYALTEVTNFNLSLGRYYQSPSYIWLVSEPSNRSLSFVGADQTVVGFDHLLRSDIKLTVEAYYKNYFDYPASLTRPFLVMANTGAGFGGTDDGFSSFGVDRLASRGEGRSQGIELFLQKKSSEIPHYGLVSVSYSRSEFKGLDGVFRPGSFDQRWIVNVGGGYILNKKWELSGKFRLASGRPYTPYNPDGTQVASQYNSRRIPANHSLDIRVERKWMFETWNLIFYLDVTNIYNRKPVDVPRYNEQTGQTENMGAIGIIPSIGIAAEF